MTRKNQHIIVAGCGRLGRHLANNFSALGHGVVAIDSEERRLAQLSAEFSGFRLEGDATELSLIKQAKAAEADLLVAVTGIDNVNLAIAQIGKVIFAIPRVVARVNDMQHEAIFRDLGIETVCPLSLAARDLLSQAATPLEILEVAESAE